MGASRDRGLNKWRRGLQLGGVAVCCRDDFAAVHEAAEPYAACMLSLCVTVLQLMESAVTVTCCGVCMLYLQAMADFWWRHLVPAKLQLDADPTATDQVEQQFRPRYVRRKGACSTTT